MTRATTALVIEDAHELDSPIQAAVEAEGFGVRVKRSPRDAIDTLLRLEPVLAVVDWHVSGPGRVSEALTLLDVRHPATVVIVVSRDLRDAAVRRTISTAHPGALMHDREDPCDHLRVRIRGILGRPFGDLVVRQGVVVHLPCHRPFRHPIAVQLVGSRGGPVRVERSTASALGVFRFQKFLVAHGSPMRVVADGTGFRRLLDTRILSPCAAAAPES